jgi:glycerol-3-phosphate dehydrogenase
MLNYLKKCLKPNLIRRNEHLKTQVLIIGGGVTGTGLARDLALRGIQCMVVEKRDLNAGASGGNHGLLHSGARYIESDPAAACECRLENQVLKQMAPHCIENTGGLFVALQGDDEGYVADFPFLCEQCRIPVQALDPADLREREPALSEKVIAAYAVEDAAIDPFKLSLDNLAHAEQLGTRFLGDSQVTGFQIRQSKIRSVDLKNIRTGADICIEVDIVVNAVGAWAGHVAALAGMKIDMLLSKGSLLVTQRRLTQQVVNRLRRATDGDILVPGGTVSILGTTSVRVESPDRVYPEIEEVDAIISSVKAMVPVLETTRYIRAYCGVRPLIGSEDHGDDRSVSRGYALIDHGEKGVDNFISISGGKLTTYRLMAEKTADLVCRKLGIDRPCRTQSEPLPAHGNAKWTEPGFAPRQWLREHPKDDLLLCECEMVPRSAVDDIAAAIRKQNSLPGLTAISLRSRVGKGPCQGTFCSQRVAAHLYDSGDFAGRQAVADMRAFLSERWRGQRPMLWDTALAQAELLEAMHCGFFGLELENDASLDPITDPTG